VILADTSAWVEYDRATGSSAHLRMRELLTAGPVSLAVTEPIVMEVLAGARDNSRARDLQRLLLFPRLIRLDPAADFHAAARIYRHCRQRGITPRGLLDCLIAAVARRTDATLLAWDSDIARVSQVIGVVLDDASRRP
jgi:predicted nucleic acid-binding protein